MESLLTAVVADDRARARSLLQSDPGLATSSVGEARLYESGIFHWLYVGDTAIHLAAAGHRVEIVQLLLERVDTGDARVTMPPNPALEGSAQELRCWVPSSLCSSTLPNLYPQ